MNSSFHPAVTPPSTAKAPGYWFIFRKSELLILPVESDGQALVPLVSGPADLGMILVREQYLGVLETEGREVSCFAGEVADDAEPLAGTEFLTLRQLFGRLDEPVLAIAGRAVQIIDWDRTHRFCGRCGSPVEQLTQERAKKCFSCGLTCYPRLSPAMIVRVERQGKQGKEILLARNHRHPSGFYSVLAGFVEPGESLEECVRREICEEVGIQVTNIRYFGSQPWPFPNSLMIAFTAEYDRGTMSLEAEEIADAGWYQANALPPVPPPISIARQMIDAFVTENLDGN